MIERVDADRRQHSRGLETGEIAEVLAVRGFRWHEPPMNRLSRATEIAEEPLLAARGPSRFLSL